MDARTSARWIFAATLAAAAAGLAAWAAWPAYRSTVYEIHTREPVSGLIPGAPVEFHGVEVGKVRAVRLVDARNVQVLLDVRQEAPVTSATIATVTARGLATRGFTGYVYVALEDNGGGKPLVAQAGSGYPAIATAPPQAVSLDATMQDLDRSVRAVSGVLQDVLDRDTIASLKQSAAALDAVARTLAHNDQRIEAILANAERASVHTQQTLARFDALSGFAADRLGVIFGNTERASTQLQPLLAAGNEAVHALQTEVLPQAQRSLVRIDRLSTSLDDTVSRVERNPALLLRGASPVPDGPGEGR